MSETAVPHRRAWDALRQFARERSVYRCDLCAAPVGETHEHLLEPRVRKLRCACLACAALMGESAGRLRRVPHRIERLSNLRLAEATWAALEIPIQLACFVLVGDPDPDGPQVVALYPSPAGMTESHPPAQAWSELVQRRAELASLEPDVEALLIMRSATVLPTHDSGDERAYIVPIDECFRLGGLVRAHWHGSGGIRGLWNAIGTFFDRLENRTRRSA